MDLLRIAARVAAGKHNWKYVKQEVLETRPDDDSYDGPATAGIWHLWKCNQCGEEIYSDKASSVPDADGCSNSKAN